MYKHYWVDKPGHPLNHKPGLASDRGPDETGFVTWYPLEGPHLSFPVPPSILRRGLRVHPSCEIAVWNTREIARAHPDAPLTRGQIQTRTVYRFVLVEHPTDPPDPFHSIAPHRVLVHGTRKWAGSVREVDARDIRPGWDRRSAR